MQLDAAGAATHRYLWAPVVDLLLADETVGDGGAEDVAWPLADHENSIRDILALNDAGTPGNPADDYWAVANHLTYEAFGRVASETNAAAADCLFAFTGRLYDSATDLQNNTARWYNAQTGRWQSEDPIEIDSGDVNYYRYCGNDPVNWIDPSGLESVTITNTGSAHSVIEVLPVPERREIPWRSKPGFWTPDSALVIAQRDGASLADLAWAVTGHPEDANMLGNLGPIRAGREVSVAPLLKMLEARLRANAVSAAKSPKNATFGDDKKRPFTVLDEREIRGVFLPGVATVVATDCDGMATLIFARAIIEELRVGEYTAMGLNLYLIRDPSFHTSTWTGSTSGLILGDWAIFLNLSDYSKVKPGGTMGQQQTIVTGDDRFIGWAHKDPLTEMQWLTRLAKDYNAGDPVADGKQPASPVRQRGYQTVPGLSGSVFINVPRLARMIFDFRTQGIVNTLP